MYVDEYIYLHYTYFPTLYCINYFQLKNEGYTTKVYAIQSEASKHIDKLVKEQNKPKKTRKSTNNSSRNQSSRNGRQNNMNKNEQRSSQSSYRQVNLSSYQPMPNTMSPNNNYCGYMPADAKSSSDKSSIGSERFDRSPSDKWHETQTSPDQVRFTSSVRHNDLLYNKESNAVQEISKNFREMNTYKAEHSNKKTNQCTEAVPFLKDVMNIDLSKFRFVIVFLPLLRMMKYFKLDCRKKWPN